MQDADENKNKATKLAGSMAMPPPVPHNPTQHMQSDLPDVYLNTIYFKFPYFLNWFTNGRMEIAATEPTKIFTKVHCPLNVAEESVPDAKAVAIFNGVKMVQTWGDNKESDCISPMRWSEASENLYSCVLYLSKDAEVGAQDQSTFAQEYRKYIDFFQSNPLFQGDVQVVVSF